MKRLVPVLGMLLIGCGEAATPAATPNDAASSPSLPGPAAATATPAASPRPAAATASNALPADVAAFRRRRDQCDHFRGEESGDDDARAAELERALERTCRGTDAELAGLRRRYRGNAAVIAALHDYEDQVE